jgi:Xaa-Pro aminopeptidase
VLVIHAPPPANAEKKLLAFETLTLAPIDRRLVLSSHLTLEELGWLDRYHARVRNEIAPLVDASTRAWLEAATAPLIRQA